MHFFSDCMSFRENFSILRSNLKTTLYNANPLEGNFLSSFLENSDRKHKTMFFLGGLSLLPFDSKTATIMKRVGSIAVGKIYKIRSDKLRDLEVTWLKVVFLFPFIVNCFIVLAFRLSSVKHMMCKINYDE